MLKKILCRSLFVVACLLTLVAFVIAEENWRGKRAWETYRRTLQERGIRLSLAEFVQPPVPDDQNFAMTSVLKRAFPFDQPEAERLQSELDFRPISSAVKRPDFGDWEASRSIDLKKWQEYLGATNLLVALKRFDPELNELNTARKLPYAKFPTARGRGFGLEQPNVAVVVQLARLYTLRGCANLAEGNVDSAAADLETIARIADSLEPEPSLLMQASRNLVIKLGLQVFWEGARHQLWSGAQLDAFQAHLQRMDALSGIVLGLQGERAIANDTMQQLLRERKLLPEIVSPDTGWERQLLKLIPRGWIYQNLICVNRYYDEQLLPCFDPSTQRFFPDDAASARRWRSQQGRRWQVHPYRFIACGHLRITIPEGLGAETQTAVNGGVVACALERYRLAFGHFPERLDALVPQFMPKLPGDVTTGQPLPYQRTNDGRFVLNSVKW